MELKEEKPDNFFANNFDNDLDNFDYFNAQNLDSDFEINDLNFGFKHLKLGEKIEECEDISYTNFQEKLYDDNLDGFKDGNLNVDAIKLQQGLLINNPLQSDKVSNLHSNTTERQFPYENPTSNNSTKSQNSTYVNSGSSSNSFSEKEEKFLEKKTKRNEKNCAVLSHSQETNSNNKYSMGNTCGLSKEEIVKLRNKISAQKSRDRKKKELLDLQILAGDLMKENKMLKEELILKDSLISELKSKLCQNCQSFLPSSIATVIKTEGDINENIVINDAIYNEITHSKIFKKPRFLLNKKVGVAMVGVLAVLCLLGTFLPQNLGSSTSQNSHNYNRNSDLSRKLSESKEVNIPFIIEKDYTNRHKLEMERRKNEWMKEKAGEKKEGKAVGNNKFEGEKQKYEERMDLEDMTDLEIRELTEEDTKEIMEKKEIELNFGKRTDEDEG